MSPSVLERMICCTVFSHKLSSQLVALIFLVICLFIGESREKSFPFRYGLSPVYLQYLENVETHFYNLLKNENLPSNLDGVTQELVENYLDEYEESVKSHDEDISSNPILSYAMLTRFLTYGRMNNQKENLFNTVFSNTTIIETDALPNTTDVGDTVEALLRLHYFYDLDALQLANGILDGTPTSGKLFSHECFSIATHALEKGYFTLALEWFDVSLHQLKSEDYHERSQMEMIKESIVQYIEETIKMHNQYLMDLPKIENSSNLYFFTEPIHSTIYSDNAHLTQRKNLVKKFFGKVIMNETDPDYFTSGRANMFALCKGESFQSEQVKAKLKCYLDTSRNPYWIINPLKLEVLSEDPEIIQLHDIIGDKTSTTLKRLAYPELSRAPTEQRTATYAWFRDEQIPNITLIKNIELITGLHVMGNGSSDTLQVAAYSFGGHVEPHFDSFSQGSEKGCVSDTEPDKPDPLLALGHRVNTFLVYLNEVKQGGRTVFPLVGLSVKPIKYSAIYWYTNLKNGKNDDRMLHVACPVIRGQKWIATKWTRSNKSVFKYPCGLTPEE